MIIVYLALALFAFVLASNIFDEFWKSLTVAIIAFSVFAITSALELWTLFIIACVLLYVVEIILLISKRK